MENEDEHIASMEQQVIFQVQQKLFEIQPHLFLDENHQKQTHECFEIILLMPLLHTTTYES